MDVTTEDVCVWCAGCTDVTTENVCCLLGCKGATTEREFRVLHVVRVLGQRIIKCCTGCIGITIEDVCCADCTGVLTEDVLLCMLYGWFKSERIV